MISGINIVGKEASINGVVGLRGALISPVGVLSTIIYKIFEANFSFHVKQRTTGNV